MNLYRKENQSLVSCSAENVFPFLRESGHIVSLVGAGGKTTLLYSLAKIAAKKGFRTLITTTTKIYEPRNGYAQSKAEIQRLWEEGKPAVVGTRTTEGKLKALPQEILDTYRMDADLVLIEADGAKHLPCKAPREQEPVLPPECDTVLAVFGLKSIGRPLEEVCFGIEEAKRLLGISEAGHIVTPMDGVTLLSSDQGGRKNIGDRSFFAMLHQCDGNMEKGAELLDALQEKGVYAFLSCETKEN